MFQTTSMTGTGLVISLVAFALQFFGIQIGTEQITTGVEALLTFVSFVLMVWRQLRRTDLVAGIFRKQ